MPNWKGKEYPYTAKGVAAYWAARGKDEKTPYKRKKVKAKSAQAKPKPSSVKKERVFRDKSIYGKEFRKRQPFLTAIEDLGAAGLEKEKHRAIDEQYDIEVPSQAERARRISKTDPTPVKGATPQPPPPKDKRTNWDKRKRKRTRPTQRSWSRGRAIPGTIGKDRFAKVAALWEKAEHDARAKDRRKTTKTGPVTTTTPTSEKPSTLEDFLRGAARVRRLED